MNFLKKMYDMDTAQRESGGADQANKMAEEKAHEILHKHVDYHGTLLPRIIKAMQEYAGYAEGLKAGGWVKVQSEKDLPEKGQYFISWNDPIDRGIFADESMLKTLLSLNYTTNLCYLSETLLPKQRQPIDTLRQWMAGCGNISKAADGLVDVVNEFDLNEGSLEDLQAHFEEYICTEMFKGVELNPPITDEQEIASKVWDAAVRYVDEQRPLPGWNDSYIEPPNREQYLASIKKGGA